MVSGGPKMTAFQSMMLSCAGEPLTPGGASCTGEAVHIIIIYLHICT